MIAAGPASTGVFNDGFRTPAYETCRPLNRRPSFVSFSAWACTAVRASCFGSIPVGGRIVR